MKSFLLLLFCMVGISSAYGQSAYEVKKVCYGSSNSAIVVEYGSSYYVVATNNRIAVSQNTIITEVTAIQLGGNSGMGFTNGPAGTSFEYVDIISSGHPVFVNNRWQRFYYSGLPGAKSICRQIAMGR